MSERTPPLVCVVGRKNSGKTGLTVALAAELNRRGRRVMTLKHGHGFQVDQPGRDSWRHRHEGGAVRTVLAGPRDFAVIGDWGREGEMPPAELARRFLWDAEIVLAEGFKASLEPRIEVFRQEAHAEPLYRAGDPDSARTLAVVTDARGFQAEVPVLPLEDPATVSLLADLLEARFLGRPGTGEANPGAATRDGDA